MATIKKDEYVFEVDVQRTREYYERHSLCECVCCRNYYAQVKERLPELDSFLSELGVDVSRPDEAMSIENDDSIDYISVDYTVCGSVISMGKQEISIYCGDVLLRACITDGFASPNEQMGKYFTVSIEGIELPWTLEKPLLMSEKGKLSSRPKRLWNRLFGR